MVGSLWAYLKAAGKVGITLMTGGVLALAIGLLGLFGSTRWPWILAGILALLVGPFIAYRDVERQVATLTQSVVKLQDRLSPRLRLEGGNGPDFERFINVGQVYQRYEGAFEPGAYVISSSKVKVFRVTNESDVGVQVVRVDVTDSSLPILALPTSLRWWHNNEYLTDLAPRTSAYAEIGIRIRLGVSLPGGGQHEYPAALGFVALPRDATITVRTWAPNGASGAVAEFRFDLPYPRGGYKPQYVEWLPSVLPVSRHEYGVDQR